MDFGNIVGYGVDAKPEFWIGPREVGEGPSRVSHRLCRAESCSRASVP
jgi:hypothetical protein